MSKRDSDLRTSHIDDVKFDSIREIETPLEINETQRVVKNLITLELIHNGFHKLRHELEKIDFRQFNGLSKMETLRLVIKQLIRLNPFVSNRLKDSQKCIASLLISNYKHLF